MLGGQKDARRLPFQLRGKATISKVTFGFPASARLKERKDFLRVREQGKKAYSQHFIMVYAPSDASSRVGVAVTKKAERLAVKRNRIKRLIREVFRLHRSRIAGNFDIVVVAKGDMQSLSYELVRKELLGMLMREGLLKRKI